MGWRYEHYKLCLEDYVAFDALGDVAERLAQAQVPEKVQQALGISAMSALVKPNKKVRGITAGNTFRRLVSKTLALKYKMIDEKLLCHTTVGCQTGAARTRKALPPIHDRCESQQGDRQHRRGGSV